MLIRSIVAVSLLATPALLSAQSASQDTLFARSPWGAEAAVGANSALSLLKLSPGGGAWVFSASGTVQRATAGATILGVSQSQTFTGGSISLGIGRRQYRGTSPLRPYVGAGVVGTFAGISNSHTIGAGGYGEIGAAYFLAPRFSVGLGGALTVSYSRERFGGSDGPTTKAWFVTAPAPTVRAAVFF